MPTRRASTKQASYPAATIGIIGGSGLYNLEGLENVQEIDVKTPFGQPSDTIVTGSLHGQSIAFIPRHGRGHQLSPTEIPARANIYALKSLGVQFLISISAVGSLREELRPMDLVIPDQLIDRTKSRINTFFDQALVAHVAFAEPFCPTLRKVLFQKASDVAKRVTDGGTYVVMEGPLFSTKAESSLYKSWGASIIGMTALPEAKLAREAEICYATIACVTDYDCWHETEESVTVEMVVANLLGNIATSREILESAIPAIQKSRDCVCATALENAIITAKTHISTKAKRDLAVLIGKYVK